MFLKLLKYEFKTIGKWYLGLYALTFIGSILIGLLFRQPFQQLQLGEPEDAIWLSGIGFSFGYVFVLGALAISNIAIIARRFKSNIFDRQGYLTMTLPVSSHAILLSKLISALIITCLTTIIFLISIAIITSIATITFDFYDFFSSLFEQFRTIPPIYLLSMFISSLSFFLLIYFSISLAHLAQSHHTLYAFLVFFGISFAQNRLSYFLYSSFTSSFAIISPLSIFNETAVAFSVALSLTICLLLYFGTHYIIKNKLNIS